MLASELPKPKPNEFLYTWELRIGVILSMLIQILLIVFGSRRKISEAIWLKIVVWCAYVSADVVATFSLGLLAQSRGELHEKKSLQIYQLRLLWIPFLIFHLGGPDTITAYSLEDNKLWLRHLLSLVIQVGVGLYTVIKSWNNHNPLLYMVCPISALGVIRYCERIWALKSATLEQIHDRFCLEWTYTCDEVYRYLSTLTFYFADMSLPTHREISNGLGMDFLNKTPLEAFRLVEVELGLVYDLLYTKASLIYCRLGICLRCLYLVSSIATLTSFVIIYKRNRSSYPLIWDVLITYFLMIGAVILDTYAFISVVSSDCTLIWLDRRKHLKFLVRNIWTCRRALFGEKRWSRRMKQYNILTSLIPPGNGRRFRIRDVFPFSLFPWKQFDAHLGEGINSMKEVAFDRQISAEDVNEMKKLIFTVISNRVNVYLEGHGGMNFYEFLHRNMDETLENYGPAFKANRRTEFIRRLFIWHIATTLCYHLDNENQAPTVDAEVRPHYNASRYLSNYFMYLVHFRQKMLPAGNYKLVYEPLESYIHQLKIRGYEWEELLEKPRALSIWVAPHRVEDGGYKTAREGVQLAFRLQDYFGTRYLDKWKMMAEFWADMLLYAASHNRWEEHVQQLRRGGEFITHVAVLLAHASLVDLVDDGERTAPWYFTI